MSRHFYIISLAMTLMVFGTGQGSTTWCGVDLRCVVADILDGSCGSCGGCEDCDGCGDCSDCAACSDCGDCGITIGKIPGTYDVMDRTSSSNVVQVRLTSHARGFISDMLQPMIADSFNELTIFDGQENFEIDVVGDVHLCRGGARRCFVTFDITEITLDTEERSSGDDRLRLRLRSRAKIQHETSSGSIQNGWPISTPLEQPSGCNPFSSSCTYCSLWNCGRKNCTAYFDTAAGGAHDHIGLELLFELGTSGVAPRADINVIDVLPLNSGPESGNIWGIEVSSDVSTSGCNLIDSQLSDGGLGSAVVNSLIAEIRERLPRIVNSFLCEKRANLVGANGVPGVCPPGTSNQTFNAGMVFLDDVVGCGNGSGSCLPILLGMEGRLDAAALLSSLAPGFDAVLDFIVAAADGATTPNSGLSVWIKGGLAPVSGQSACVPALDPEEIPPVANVPRTQLFQNNSHPGGRATDVMVGVAEAFVNRAAYDLWNTGALCLQISSATLPMLDPALVGILFASDLKNLVFPASDSDSPLGVGLRPQKPPTIRFDNAEGGGVKVGVAMPELQLDFYAWSLDRYVRFVTFQLDIDIAVAVKANAGKIQLDLLGVDITNTRALNDSLISNGGSAANLITGVVGSLLPAFLGDSGPLFELDIAGILPESLDLGGMNIPMPLSIELRDDALAAVYTNASGATIPARDENGHAFLGVFVDFAGGTGGGGSGLTAAVDTQVDITSVYIPEDKSAFAAETFGQGELPRVEFVMSASAPAGVPVEYRYRLGLGGWSEWQDSPYGVIEDPLLLLQQEHTIFARARVKGEPRTEDRSSAKARFSTDVTPPMVDITAEAKGIRIQAVDFHTRASELEYRFREPEGEFSEWAKLGPEATALIDASRDVEVEVRDAAGNVASNVAELRGLPPSSAAAGGCSCSAAGPVSGSSNSLLGFLAMVAMVGGMMYRLRRREEKV